MKIEDNDGINEIYLKVTIQDLEEENKKLKDDLSECECSMHFENDEVGYRKREYKRLKQRIKDHCKGYGNLFPEDEMKRQRKKADKKRKKEEIRVARDEHSYAEIWGDDEMNKKTKLFEGEHKYIPKKL